MQVPGNADVAFVDNPAAGSTVTVDTNNPQNQRIEVRADNTIDLQTGGAIGTSGDAFTGINTGGNVTQSGGSLTVGAWGFVGRDGGAGTYAQSGGLHQVNGQSHIGFNPGSTGTYNLSGGTHQVGSDLAFGVNGSTGTMHQSGGTVNAGWTFVGKNQDNIPGSVGNYNISTGDLNVFGTMTVAFRGATNGTVNQTGGNVMVTKVGADAQSGHLNVGLDGGNGTYLQSGGAASSHWGFVARGGGGSVGNYTHTGGTYSTKGWVRIAEGAGATGTYHLSGNATLNVGGADTDLGDDDLVVGIDGGNGTLNIAGMSQLNAARDVRVGVNSGSVGDVNQTGGTHAVQRDLIIADGAGSTGTYDLSGGTLNMTGGAMSFGGGAAAFNMTGGRLENASAVNFFLDQQGGTLAVGAGIGTTTITGNGMHAYQLGAAGTLEIELASSSSFDQVIANGGSVALFASGNLDIIASTGLSFFDMFTIIDVTDPTKVVGGAFAGKPDDSIFSEDGYDFQIDYNAGPDGNNVTLTVVPEPGTLTPLGAGALALLARRRGRKG